MDRKEVCLDLDKLEGETERLSEIIFSYLEKDMSAEEIAEAIWNNEEYSNEEVAMLLITIGYLARLVEEERL